MSLILSEAPKGDEKGKNLKVGGQYVVQRPGHPPRVATILNTRVNKRGIQEAYITFLGQDKRLDLWIKEDELGEEIIQAEADPSTKPINAITTDGQKDPSQIQPEAGPSTPIDRDKRSERSPRSNASTPEREHAAMTRVRNFEDVRFGEYLIKTWYYSPYPLPLNDPSHPQHPQTHTPQAESSSSSAKKRKFDANNNPTLTPDQTISSIENSHRPHLKHSRTVNEMYSGVGKGGEGARGRLWVCDLCFKYMKTRTGWDRHTSSCKILQPPGRKVYQRGSYTIWEVDGANATLYCQNLSLFGKLFIDHKSVFFHVENFLFYVLCDAATSRRDQVMAFFSKEKISYDDYNLACIVTFPPFQNRGFGKLLIEFSYYLTKHPSTRPSSQSPGTPERPLSDLGLKGYTAYWVSVILRFLKNLLADSEPFKPPHSNESPTKIKSPIKAKVKITPVTPVKEGEGRVLRVRKPLVDEEKIPVGVGGKKDQKMLIVVDGVGFTQIPIPNYKGQYSISLDLSTIAKSCHLRLDDISFTLSELGFLTHRRKVQAIQPKKRLRNGHGHGHSALKGESGEEQDDQDEEGIDDQEEIGEEWKDIEIVISKEMVDEQWKKWRVRDKGVLQDEFVLL
ncbi:hypothetical protein I203_101884 [Kwoniella mangroviensis CBS 8507]|uniref:uncharacterized protein n=1 Tax=Kwoniella mangroviensis CBS 8507 TaxID=1296122 RepID=UPI00080CCEB9|nr:uncharacterized protein I203_03080 [Kwoniella mangroviensis CBS 8507]OCF67386.1 hypothetical protein I203_03080 [Kwoniella mangroviensis CBS 8507]